MFFRRKHIETEQSFLHELTCFLKYHMALKRLKNDKVIFNYIIRNILCGKCLENFERNVLFSVLLF